MKMQYKIIFAIAIAVIFPTLIIALVSITSTISKSNESFINNTQNEIRQIDNGFQLFFEQVKAGSKFLAKQSIVKKVPENTQTYFGEARMMTSLQGVPEEANIFMLYKEYGDSHDELLYVYLGTENGGFIQYPPEKIGNYDPRKRPWYQMGKNRPDSAGITAAYQGVTGGPMVSVAYSIMGDNGELLGVQSMDVSLKTLTDILQSIKLGESGYLMLMDNTGSILADPVTPANNFKKVSDISSPLFEQLARTTKNNATANFETQHNGKNVTVTTYYSTELGWHFIGIIHSSEIAKPAYEMSGMIIVIALLMVGAFVLLGVWLSRRLVAPVEEVATGLRDIAQGEGDLTQRLQIDSNDESGKLAQWFNQFLTSISGLVLDIKDDSQQLARKSSDIGNIVAEIKSSSHAQDRVVRDSVQNISQMASAAQEVSDNCGDTLNIVSNTEAAATEGTSIIGTMVKDVSRLSETMTESASAMGELENESNNINNILGVIRGIAEQTNLLALNAAIEAARAGEQGRGFAVVADEVRTLAQRSHVATEEIEGMLEKLTDKTRFVSNKMTISLEQSQQAVSQSQQANEAFASISHSVEEIQTRLNEIAKTATQQLFDSQQVDGNVNEISGAIKQVVSASDELAGNAEELLNLSSDLNNLVGKFKVRQI